MKRTRRQAFGQHFLSNRAVLQKIVRVIAPGENDIIIEIGAGKGALTHLLTGTAGRVIAIEKDHLLIPQLREREGPGLTILEADVLELDFAGILRDAGGGAAPAKLVGNLPYSISSPILFKAIEARGLFAKCVFLLQKEVAERVCARPGTRASAPVSLLVQNAFEARIEFSVSPGSFSPPPRVDSALISLTLRPKPLFPSGNEPGFAKFLWAAFAHRRKLLSKNLEAAGLPRERIRNACAAMGLTGNARAEELTLEQFVGLYRALRAR